MKIERSVNRGPRITQLLKDLSQNPAGMAAAYGKLSGRCCFCASELTDDKSISVGYGPVCAKNYSLPYGVQAAKTAKMKLAA